jgi:hypothetical protein
MTVKEMNALVSQKAAWHVEGLEVVVTIYDVKRAWGNTLVLISPDKGTGEKWVNLEKLNLPIMERKVNIV